MWSQLKSDVAKQPSSVCSAVPRVIWNASTRSSVSCRRHWVVCRSPAKVDCPRQRLRRHGLGPSKDVSAWEHWLEGHQPCGLVSPILPCTCCRATSPVPCPLQHVHRKNKPVWIEACRSVAQVKRFTFERY